MKIEILGPGCPKCQQTEKNVTLALQHLGLDVPILHLTDVKEIVRRGVIFTPAVSFDGQIVISGQVPTVDEVLALLEGRIS